MTIRYGLKVIDYNYKCGCQFEKTEHYHPATGQYLPGLDVMRLINKCTPHATGKSASCFDPLCESVRPKNSIYCKTHLQKILSQ